MEKLKSDECLIFSSNDIEPEFKSVKFLGGKGLNLVNLSFQGFNVPPFVILNANELHCHFQKESEIDTVWIEKINSILGDYRWFSVRSSAIQEDSIQYSFAGQFKTELYVGWNDLSNAIQLVWDSIKSPNVLTYCEEHNLEAPDRMAIIIQVMVNSEISGVAFGVNPVNGRRDEMIISSVYGLGEGIVSGELNADTFTVTETSKIISAQTSPKKKKLVQLQQGTLDPAYENQTTTVWVDVDPSIQESPSLSSVQIEEISGILNKLKRIYKRPQDIEFALEKDQLFLLQTRPVTTLGQIADPTGEMILWDNSNIIESYPGVTTPLTFSFIIKMYESVYVQLCRLLGVSEGDLTQNKTIFENMLGLIQGRVYYNLLSWYKALALLPGFHLNAEFMEKMMGVKERFELKNLPKRTKWNERFRVLIMLRSMWKNLRGLPQMRINFQRDFQEVLNEYNAIDLKSKSAHELMELYLNFEQTLLKKWKAPLVNDFYAMIYFGVLQKLVEKYELPQGIHNDLLSGADDIISTQPIKRMEKMRDWVWERQDLTHQFKLLSVSELMQYIEKSVPDLQSQFMNYIQDFGDRCVGELKLETITYRQDPEMLMQLLKMYVCSERVDHKSLKLREIAEDLVDAGLRKHSVKRKIFQFVLKKTRILVSARENLRFERTRGFGKVREIFLAIGDVFYFEGIIENPRDIFYLTQNEIFDFIKGTAVTPELADLIQFRKSKYLSYENQTTAERIRTFGMVYHANIFNAVLNSGVLSGDLQGIGCCPGWVNAQVQVVHHPSEITELKGDILVTASTDPGWVTLFPSAGGILVERGSLLSHSAIVSRELGKPCIVGITGLLSRLKTGDWVEMDGSTGCVKIIREPAN